MGGPRTSLREMDAADRRFAWDLNQSEVPHVGSETVEEFERICSISVFARLAAVDGEPAGFLLGMTPDADYRSPNYIWFRERYTDFLYVDRIVVSRDARKRGVGAALYREAETYARDHDLGLLCCEVNLRPPNPGSLAFHGRVGFSKVGTFENLEDDKTVAMLVKSLC